MRTVRRHFRPTRLTIDGVQYDSTVEAKRRGQLQLLQCAGIIRDLRRKPRLPLVVNGKKIGRGYLTLDFAYAEYVDGAWRDVIEDVKSVDTRESRLRRELAEALHGVKIKVVQA